MRFSAFILRNVFRRRTRSALTMTGMAVAMGAVVALVGISDGFKQTFLDIYQKRGVGLIVMRSDVVSPLTGLIPEEVGAEIANLEGVTAVCPGLMDVQSFENLGLHNIVMQGWPADAYMFNELQILEGQRLTKEMRGKKAIMLGKDLARNAQLKVGSEVDLSEDKYHVAGIFETFSGPENSMMFMLLDDAQRLKGTPGKVTGCTVKVKDMDPDSVQRIRGQIEKDVAEKLKLKGKIRAAPPGELVGSTTQIVAARAMAWITSAIALVIGVISMLNTMVMSVFERTREIGILRAIGWRPWRVMRMILMESMILSLAGAVVGTVGGITLAWGLSRLPQVNGVIQGYVSVQVILTAFVIALLVGLIGAAYPAYRGARLLPTEALRHE